MPAKRSNHSATRRTKSGSSDKRCLTGHSRTYKQRSGINRKK